ncbi:metallo-beta-lactamase domain containing protein [Entamoeba histolytica HM-1:IMSS-B]|uniref:Metallo-beta-lactamase domain-containing protein n=6 Tax=Entamoeba histolytica TaxID=5759 RepID=C4LVX4_ENTH1|nr:metallo-beta-lactamase domain-containing protein [Entamoeba histolytica HM-1:IMSS]EMD49502.1 metallobeta-lactamase domain containing protein [Entamoeba histolytica KU27]EMH73044.1 metallo-beta-lactamase domain containing protein [Entamoeba histolytica HM-1:IMSS-B]EMS14456.1 metallo-beta-lactamase domain containing protein [Entamoeba histolytica HM-3:IMSS]ENY62929.1 metallo-beta-lactamase domain containing protein [Entamoeba histolytica HM-1:IMSS-A]GAT92832.1 metallo-beta-lactamase domain-co|eukprot:XP_656488.2 metallo-beta-lactamase domain-containing protein [Entamoeba histolytica HM-1:IMSS]
MLKLIPLGTSAGQSTIYRNTTSNLIEMQNGRFILIDCGDGILNTIIKLGINVKRIELVLITHLHSDHVSGIIALLFNWILNDCDVYLPEGGDDLIETFKRISKSSINESIRIHQIPKGDHDKIITLSSGVSVGCIEIPHEIESHGFVFKDQRGLVVCVLGDTSGRNLNFLYKVHVLVHECTFGSSSEIKWGHSNCKIAAQCAESVYADYLLLNHFSVRFKHPQQFVNIEQQTSQLTEAEVIILNDFETFDLSSVPVN